VKTYSSIGVLVIDRNPEFVQALLQSLRKLGGQPTTNLQVTLQKDLKLGSRTFTSGTVINTGIDVEKGGKSLFGFENGLSCAACHVTLSAGERLVGVPNSDLNIAFLIALATNSASGFARLDFDPLDPKYQGNGKTILDSRNNFVKLPDPQKFEDAFDDALLDLPAGNFESSPDKIDNTTQIPSLFTFRTGPYTADGQFAVGPFAGLSSITSAVHSSELNLAAAAQLSQETIGIDPEVYLGTILQNAADPKFRLPEGEPVKPSVWLRQIAPDPNQTELSEQPPAPDTGSYPNLKPTLFTYNGLVFSPNTNQPNDLAAGKYLSAANAMAAFQNSLVPPSNRSPENKQALESRSVVRGARVFKQAKCITCHISPFFTDNVIHPIREIGTNPARAKSRLALDKLLVPPKLYTFNTSVPIQPGAEVIDIPTEDISDKPTTLPKGLLPDGGYKTTSLLGLYFSAPYLHDSGVAVSKDSLKVESDGSFSVVNSNGLGLPGTLSQGKPADPANSLRALVDKELRAQVIVANKANPGLVRSNLDGTGHEFYVDRTTRFTPTQQTDLINFMLALDDNPGNF
jgi:mono/diheme cytochrome c family protein